MTDMTDTEDGPEINDAGEAAPEVNYAEELLARDTQIADLKDRLLRAAAETESQPDCLACSGAQAVAIGRERCGNGRTRNRFSCRPNAFLPPVATGEFCGVLAGSAHQYFWSGDCYARAGAVAALAYADAICCKQG